MTEVDCVCIKTRQVVLNNQDENIPPKKIRRKKDLFFSLFISCSVAGENKTALSHHIFFIMALCVWRGSMTSISRGRRRRRRKKKRPSSLNESDCVVVSIRFLFFARRIRLKDPFLSSSSPLLLLFLARIVTSDALVVVSFVFP